MREHIPDQRNHRTQCGLGDCHQSSCKLNRKPPWSSCF